jgi:hypothetical protein
MDQQLVRALVDMERACWFEQRLPGAGHRHWAHGLKRRHVVQYDRWTGDWFLRTGQYRGHGDRAANVAGIIHGDHHARRARRRLHLANNGGEPTGRLWLRGRNDSRNDTDDVGDYDKHYDDEHDDRTATWGDERTEPHDDTDHTNAETSTGCADNHSSHHGSIEAQRARLYRNPGACR